MIYLKTGQPGHGKTLRAIEQALAFKAKGREVYAHGIRGLNYAEAGFHELADPKEWQSLPDGSVILLDECYTTFPKAGGTAKVPDYIQALATHRHRGFDFILVCQQASQQLHGFVLGLVQDHEHIRRKFGFKKAIVLWWDRYQSNVKASDTKKFWNYPRALMKRNLYESTVQDTTEKRVPWYIYALPLLALVVFGLMKYATGWFGAKTARPGAAAGQHGDVPSSVAGFGGNVQQRPDDIAKWLKPRIEGQPWTAPAYDQVPIASRPEVYCMAVEDGRCSCITEQGTPYVMKVDLCRSIAANGYYNPTRPPLGQVGAAGQVVQPPAPAPAKPRGVSQGEALGGEGRWQGGVGAQTYTPPGEPGSWNPDALARNGGR